VSVNDGEPIDGRQFREELIRRGLIVPAERVVEAPVKVARPTLRLLGTEDWRKNIDPRARP